MGVTAIVRVLWFSRGMGLQSRLTFGRAAFVIEGFETFVVFRTRRP